jgi:hypothetical protein
MSDQVLIELDPCAYKSKPEDYNMRCRNLILAIFYQACEDKDLSFFSPTNKVFVVYCDLLDLNPDWAAKKIRATINRRT